MAIAGFAPPLDKFGNSVRAQEAIRYLAEQLDLNIFGSSK
jgi:glutaminase